MVTQNLVVDIGGTNTRMALADHGEVQTDTIRRFRNADHAEFVDALRLFLADLPRNQVERVAICLAGPVDGDRGILTNRDWTLHCATLAQQTNMREVLLLNDLQAQGYGLATLAPEDRKQIIAAPVPTQKDATQLVINVGTGFNIAPVYSQNGALFVPASEAGHASLPARTAQERAMLADLTGNSGSVSVEELLSGIGIPRIYDWLARDYPGPGREAPEILAALDAGEPRAEATMALFVSLLGGLAGNMALVHLPFGGLALVGGVARAAAPYFDRFGFMQAFRDKGRFSDYMHRFPVYLVLDDYTALKGVARFIDQHCRNNVV